MRYKLTAVLTVAVSAVLAGSAIAPASGVPLKPAITPVPDGWCATPSPEPCVVSADRGAVALTDGGDYDISVGDTSNSGAHSASFQFSQAGSAVHDPTTGSTYTSLPDTDINQQFSVTLRVSFNPRETDEYAKDVSVTKSDNGDGTWDVTFTGNAVAQGVNDECNPSVSPAVCPATAGANITAYFGEVSDFQQWNDASQWVDFNGMNTATNVEEVGVPPQISGDPLTITADLANSQYLHGGRAPFQGFYDVVLPNQFLIDMGIDDPSTLDPSGIAAAIGSGTVTVTPGASSTEVDVTGITFPATTSGHAVSARIVSAVKKSKGRLLHIKRGTITPSRPTITKGKRHSTSVKLTFSKARPRGSHLRHYEVRCRAQGQMTRTVTGKHSPLVVKHLTSGVAYKCQVRAKAKAGYGGWSKKHSVRR